MRGGGDQAASPLTSACSPAFSSPGCLVTNVVTNDHFVTLLVIPSRHFPWAVAPAAQTGIDDPLGLGDVLHLFKNECLLSFTLPPLPLSLPSLFRKSHISGYSKPHPL